MVLICSLTTYNDPYYPEVAGDYAHMAEVSDWLKDNYYYKGWATFWNGNIITELTDGQVEMWMTWSETSHLVMFPWLQAKSHDNPPDGQFFFLLDTKEYDRTYRGNRVAAAHIQYQDDYYKVMVFESTADYDTINTDAETN